MMPYANENRFPRQRYEQEIGLHLQLLIRLMLINYFADLEGFNTSLGDIPNLRLNRVLKCAELLNPKLKAVEVMDLVVPFASTS